jgi:hypothetical protein
MAQCKVCKPVFYKHEDGWDAYPQRECYRLNGEWIPAWFDGFLVEDAPTKAAAQKEVDSLHLFGMCLWME